MQVIGVISDTHGLFRPEIKEIFHGCDLIIHAGDVGDKKILEKLEKIAKVIAIKGNIDKGELAEKLKLTEQIRILNTNIFVIHDITQLSTPPSSTSIDIVIYGHSHKAVLKEEDNILYFNPGSAGPRRFRLPVSLGLLKITSDKIMPEIIRINVE